MQLFTSLYLHNKQRSKSFATVNTEESLTQQSDRDDADINIIMKKYGKTGQLPQVVKQPLYGDFTEAPDFRGMVDKIKEANDAFQAIPAKIRARFDHDPAQFIEFATNKDNLEELRKMGLAPPAPEPPKEPEPMRVRIIPDNLSPNPPGGQK